MTRLLREQFAGWRAGEVAWLCFCLSAVTALSLHWGDGACGITAALTGMLYTVLAGKGKISCFLFGLVNTPLYAFLAFRQGYYGDMALNLYYFAMMFPGFVGWWRHRAATDEEGVVRTRLRTKDRRLLAGIVCVATLALWAVLTAVGGTRPLCDALTNVLSVAAMFLTVRRAVEQWVLWIAVNAVEVFMWWTVWSVSGQSVSILLMWLLFLANGVYLLTCWLRTARRHPFTETAIDVTPHRR